MEFYLTLAKLSGISLTFLLLKNFALNTCYMLGYAFRDGYSTVILTSFSYCTVSMTGPFCLGKNTFCHLQSL